MMIRSLPLVVSKKGMTHLGKIKAVLITAFLVFGSDFDERLD